MAPSRVGTVTFDWYPFHARVRSLAEAAVEAGYWVDVICARQRHEPRYEVCNGVHVYRLPINRRFDRSLPGTILNWCWFLLLAGVMVSWLHLKHPYRVIHVHNMPDFLIFAAVLPKLLGAKLILDVQDASPELMADKAHGPLRARVTRLAIWQERLSTTFADHVVTVGWTVEELLLQRGVPREKLTSILNSANPAFFPPSRRSLHASASAGDDQPFILMYHGTVTERQGLDIAIRALTLARRVAPKIRLDIKGSKEQLPTLEPLATELGVLDQVVLSSACPIAEVVDFVLHGDVGIIPYRAGGYMELVLPVKAFEFAWMHRPMIASDLRGIRSLFRPESIVLCDPARPESFAEAIIDLYQHPETRARLAANAAEDYEPYRWEGMAKRYQQLLASLSSA
ncbi:MAG TPA: glycosyltransferase family 4 protein [Ktedonosporobacter sp.]|nr:glycosyltransferase family 4 protein [Ktedonosporobacter sp.]